MPDIYDFIRDPEKAAREGYKYTYLSSVAYCFTLPAVIIYMCIGHEFFQKGKVIGDILGLFIAIFYCLTFILTAFPVALIHYIILDGIINNER